MKNKLILILAFLVSSSAFAADECIHIRVRAEHEIHMSFKTCDAAKNIVDVEKQNIRGGRNEIISVVMDKPYDAEPKRSYIEIASDYGNFSIPALNKYGFDCKGRNKADARCYVVAPNDSEWDYWQTKTCVVKTQNGTSQSQCP